MYGHRRTHFEDYPPSHSYSSPRRSFDSPSVMDPWSTHVDYDCQCARMNCRHRDQHMMSTALDDDRLRRRSFSCYGDDDDAESTITRPYEEVRYRRTEREYRHDRANKVYTVVEDHGHDGYVPRSTRVPYSGQGISVNGNTIYAGGHVTYIENMKLHKDDKRAHQMPCEIPLHTITVEDRTGLWPKRRRYIHVSPKQKVSQLLEELLGKSRSRRLVAHRGHGLGKMILSRHHSMETILQEVKYLEIVYAEQTVLVRRF